ncbi:MAG: ABC transporter ATP-binding protein [Cellulosilyticaceae bacterium]
MKNTLKVFMKVFPILFKVAPILLILLVILNVLHAFSWGLTTVATQQLFDRALQLVEGNTTFVVVLMSLLMMGLVNILCQVLNGLANFMPSILIGKADGKLSLDIHCKIARLEPIYFEEPQKLDAINKAEMGKSNALWFVFMILMIVAFYIPYYIFMGAYLFSLKPILAWGILLVFLPTAASQILRTKVFTKLEDDSAPLRRANSYYEECIVSREYFKETRLLGGFNYFKEQYVDTLKLLNKLSFRSSLKTDLCELGLKCLTILGYVGVIYLLFDALMKQEITVGAFAAVVNAVGMMYNIMEEVICRHLGSLAQQIGTVQNYISFLDLKEREPFKGSKEQGEAIKLEGVTFSYPNTDKRVLDQVDLTIKKGETLAIVGENGSGKSTLIRIITGLYKPQHGIVHHGNLDIKNQISGVFQKYQRYQLTLQDNITISDRCKEVHQMALDQVCQAAGVENKNECFKDGYDTMLSREFDGIDLSGGQWQRVALARGLYRTHELIILDEPTAAIDPIEETRIYQNFAQMVKGKTGIVVTHRLGSAKIADRIVVMKEGRIVELGNHEELLRCKGEYSRLYEAQEQWYVS